MVKQGNLVLAFLLELGVLAALAYWGGRHWSNDPDENQAGHWYSGGGDDRLGHLERRSRIHAAS